MGLSRAETELGLTSDILIADGNYFNFNNCKKPILLPSGNAPIYKKFLKRFDAFLKIRKKYDVFHFNFGSSLLNFPDYHIYFWDLPFYSRKAKKIFTYNGCDARQKFPTMHRTGFSACHENNCYNGICNSGKMDKIRQKNIIKASKYADHIFALNPDLMHFLPAKKTSFLPYTIAGWNEISPVSFVIDKKIKIVHAPTNRIAKGSDYILRALNNLKKKYPIELNIVEGVPNSQALKLYRESHIIIDQVLIGWYGGFAVEAMKMGKPVAVFIREEDLRFIPSQMVADIKDAVININPFNIEEVLGKYLEDTSLLKKKAEASMEYVNKWHDPLSVAGVVKKIYES